MNKLYNKGFPSSLHKPENKKEFLLNAATKLHRTLSGHIKN